MGISGGGVLLVLLVREAVVVVAAVELCEFCVGYFKGVGVVGVEVGEKVGEDVE